MPLNARRAVRRDCIDLFLACYELIQVERVFIVDQFLHERGATDHVAHEVDPMLRAGQCNVKQPTFFSVGIGFGLGQ
jgi:hypothetical protein